jgi:hypothetical protein
MDGFAVGSEVTMDGFAVGSEVATLLGTSVANGMDGVAVGLDVGGVVLGDGVGIKVV